MRGLKLHRLNLLENRPLSHLTQVRGLKLLLFLPLLPKILSHLTQVRGLKYARCRSTTIPWFEVAPYTGAWIEILINL